MEPPLKTSGYEIADFSPVRDNFLCLLTAGKRDRVRDNKYGTLEYSIEFRVDRAHALRSASAVAAIHDF
jgi:hypothetical protein